METNELIFVNLKSSFNDINLTVYLIKSHVVSPCPPPPLPLPKKYRKAEYKRLYSIVFVHFNHPRVMILVRAKCVQPAEQLPV